LLQLLVDLPGRELMQALPQALGHLLVGHALARNADHTKIIGQEIAGLQVVQRRNHQAMRQVAGGAEEDKATGFGLVTVGHVVGL
jgi:hypothetical protein